MYCVVAAIYMYNSLSLSPSFPPLYPSFSPSLLLSLPLSPPLPLAGILQGVSSLLLVFDQAEVRKIVKVCEGIIDYIKVLYNVQYMQLSTCVIIIIPL